MVLALSRTLIPVFSQREKETAPKSGRIKEIREQI